MSFLSISGSEFTLDEEIYEIAAVLDQWYQPSATYFKVQSTEGKTYLLRYDEEADEWTLQSGFDGDELLARLSIELVTVDSAIAKKVEQQIESCEHCHPDDAEIPFDWPVALRDSLRNTTFDSTAGEVLRIRERISPSAFTIDLVGRSGRRR